nr:unnamed protein product [Digitaria exilis]
MWTVEGGSRCVRLREGGGGVLRSAVGISEVEKRSNGGPGQARSGWTRAESVGLGWAVGLWRVCDTVKEYSPSHGLRLRSHNLPLPESSAIVPPSTCCAPWPHAMRPAVSAKRAPHAPPDAACPHALGDAAYAINAAAHQ